MTTSLQHEIEHWEAELDRLAETSASESWLVEERRLAEAQYTLTAYRSRILPLFACRQQYDAIVAEEMIHLLDRLEDLRDDLFRTVHPVDSHEHVAETVAALRVLGHIAYRFDQTLEAAR